MLVIITRIVPCFYLLKFVVRLGNIFLLEKISLCNILVFCSQWLLILHCMKFWIAFWNIGADGMISHITEPRELLLGLLLESLSYVVVFSWYYIACEFPTMLHRGILLFSSFIFNVLTYPVIMLLLQIFQQRSRCSGNWSLEFKGSCRWVVSLLSYKYILCRTISHTQRNCFSLVNKMYLIVEC